MSYTNMNCAECGKSFNISITHKSIWTAFCSPTHAAKWQSERNEEEILKHQFGDSKPWSDYDRCQWCHSTLKSGYHEESCPVRDAMAHQNDVRNSNSSELRVHRKETVWDPERAATCSHDFVKSNMIFQEKGADDRFTGRQFPMRRCRHCGLLVKVIPKSELREGDEVVPSGGAHE